MEELKNGEIDANNIEGVANLQTETENELRQLQSLNVWSENQETLEEQALKELEILSKEISSNKENSKLIDNKLVESADSFSKEYNNNFTLEDYLKRQEELKRCREQLFSTATDNVTETITKHTNHSSTPKVLKRKHSSSCISAPPKTIRRRCSNYVHDYSGSEYVPSDNSDAESNEDVVLSNAYKRSRLSRPKDDGDLKLFKIRLNQYYEKLAVDKEVIDDIQLSDGLQIPAKVWNNLYSYQQEGVEWLWNIHRQSTGGLLGDEMGLGKTVQVIAFLVALNHSQVVSNYGRFRGLGPTLIVAPATVIQQWVNHFHEWAPEFRVGVLHQSGSYTGNKARLINEMHKEHGILVTSYSGILKYKDNLTELNWHYLILDEGHKIRNAAAKVSMAVKRLQTAYRLMLTGSPMQNNLQELWSLFDFIAPGVLGTLPVFMEHFANPIMQGGYANATPMQETTALSVATALKDIISKHLLRRSKDKVKKHISLPNKNEQVLFCSLTDEQKDIYKQYLMGDHVNKILGKNTKNWFSENQMRANVLISITALRKICNHPDIYLSEGDDSSCHNKDENMNTPHGYYKRSGKMIVVSALLKIWKKQNHRVLLFTQSRAMIAIFEIFLQQEGYKYLKMDGNTSVSLRQPLIDKFNKDSSYDVFLLTTRVGGLGVNLTGANRVIIYDPDWNPATDTQARERAWRIGQEKPVTIYRLILAGTIEEKMYQRQVWKQLLTNKVLLKPETQRFFKVSDLQDLFSLQEPSIGSHAETANIFYKSRVNLQRKIARGRRSKKSETDTSSAPVQFSDEKIQAMKSLAQQISKRLNSSVKEEIKKTPFQKELEEERLQKLQQKQQLKMLTPAELRTLNREKTVQTDTPCNKIDDSETNISFSTALDVVQKTTKVYHDIKDYKIKLNESSSSSLTQAEQTLSVKDKKKKPKDRKKEKVKVDKSGTVEGEFVEGLVKSETKIKKKLKNGNDLPEEQDYYVLEKLFARKGVNSALEHDDIVQGVCKNQNRIKLNWEAEQRTNKSLEALKKSRLESWRW